MMLTWKSHAIPIWHCPSWLLGFGLLGSIADADFLIGLHSTYTHSIGAAVIAGLLTSLWVSHYRTTFGCSAAGAYATHVLLDWLGSDPVFPFGIMALWPINEAYHLSNQQWFLSVCREYWLPSCWWHNTQALIWEVIVFGPLALGSILLLKRPLPAEHSASTST